MVSVHVLSLRGATAVLNAVKEAISKWHWEPGIAYFADAVGLFMVK